MRFRFSVLAVPLQNGFSVLQYSLAGRDGSGFGSWKTVRRFRFHFRFRKKRFRRFRFPVPVRFLSHPENNSQGVVFVMLLLPGWGMAVVVSEEKIQKRSRIRGQFSRSPFHSRKFPNPERDSIARSRENPGGISWAVEVFRKTCLKTNSLSFFSFVFCLFGIFRDVDCLWFLECFLLSLQII